VVPLAGLPPAKTVISPGSKLVTETLPLVSTEQPIGVPPESKVFTIEVPPWAYSTASPASKLAM